VLTENISKTKAGYLTVLARERRNAFFRRNCSLRYCHDVRLSVCLSVSDERALWS